MQGDVRGRVSLPPVHGGHQPDSQEERCRCATHSPVVCLSEEVHHPGDRPGGIRQGDPAPGHQIRAVRGHSDEGEARGRTARERLRVGGAQRVRTALLRGRARCEALKLDAGEMTSWRQQNVRHD